MNFKIMNLTTSRQYYINFGMLTCLIVYVLTSDSESNTEVVVIAAAGPQGAGDVSDLRLPPLLLI